MNSVNSDPQTNHKECDFWTSVGDAIIFFNMPKILDTNPDSEPWIWILNRIATLWWRSDSESGFVSRIFGILKKYYCISYRSPENTFLRVSIPQARGRHQSRLA